MIMETIGTVVDDAQVEDRIYFLRQQKDRKYDVLSRIFHSAKKHLSQSGHKNFAFVDQDI